MVPTVQGRATIEMDVSLERVRNKGAADAKLYIVVDGYNAPVTAGNFVDLVDKKFYDGMDVQRADGFVVQTGDPGGDVRTYCLSFPYIRLSGANLKGPIPGLHW